MADAPGLPRVILKFWLVFFTVLVAVSVGHLLALAPMIMSASLIIQEFAVYTMYATMAWLVIYSAMTINIFRFSDIESLSEFIQNMGKWQKTKLVVFLVILVNSIVFIGAAIGFLVGSQVSTSLGILFAMVYPTLEIWFLNATYTPGKLILQTSIKAAHLIGTAKGIDSDDIISTFMDGFGPPQKPMTP